MTTTIARGPEDPLLKVDHTDGSGNPALWFQQDGQYKMFLWYDLMFSISEALKPIR
jgi:hypothetical protein